MNDVKQNYPGTEENLYTVTGMIYQNCLDDINVFSKHKKRYIITFLEAIIKQKDAAEALPNQDQRQSNSEALGNAVKRAAGDCCDDLQYLFTYINTDSFSEDDIDAMKKQAGDDYYADAVNGNWQATNTMNGMMIGFIKKYPTELAKADMPDDFLEQCTGRADTFSDAVTNYSNYKSTAPQETAAKVTANNELYTALSSILKDGKYIFRKNAVKRRLYSYNALLDKIRKKKTGSHITLTNPVLRKGVEGAVISFVQSEKTEVSNKKGVILVELSEGNYDYTIIAKGYQTLQGVLVVDKNVVHRVKIDMVKLADKEDTA